MKLSITRKSRVFPVSICIILLLYLTLLSATRAFAGDPRRAHYSNDNNHVFWFMLISDTHIGADGRIPGIEGLPPYPDCNKNLQWAVKDGFSIIDPKFIINLGDLTDQVPHSLNTLLGEHNEYQWSVYTDIISNAGMYESNYFDAPGNHDQYFEQLAPWYPLYNYKLHSVQGIYTGDTQRSWSMTLPNYGKYHFITVATPDPEMAPPKRDLDNRCPGELNEEELSFIKDALDANTDANLTFVFGHHALKDWGAIQGGHEQLINYFNQYGVSMYGYGHTHLKDYRPPFFVNVNGALAFNVASLAEDARYAIVAVDNDGISVTNVDGAVVGSGSRAWPIVLITTPINKKLVEGEDNPFAYPIPNSSENVVRALIFCDPDYASIWTVKILVNGEYAGVMNPVQGNSHLWEGSFDGSRLWPEEYQITVWAECALPSPYLPPPIVVGSDTITVDVKAATGLGVDNALRWLRNHQLQNGSWSNNSGITSLATLAFLNFGYNESDPAVSKGLQYIFSNIHPDGSVGDYSGQYTYCTSMAILPFVATRNPAYSGIVAKMRDWLIGSQWDESNFYFPVDKGYWYYGGFGYGDGQRPDLSNTQWALMGLSAAGLGPGGETLRNAATFIQSCQRPDGADYYPPGYFGEIHSMTAASVWSYALCGIGPGDDRVARALLWLSDHYSVTNCDGQGNWGEYYYSLTLAKALVMSHKVMLGTHDWFKDLSQSLIDRQGVAGDWPATGIYGWGQADQEVNTAFAILALETRTLAPNTHPSVSIKLASHADLHVYDQEGRHIGVNYDTMSIELEIPGGSFKILDANGQEVPYNGNTPAEGLRQVVDLSALIAGSYRIELVGTSTGPFDLTIEGKQDGEIVTTNTYTGQIVNYERLATSATATAMDGALTIIYEPLKVMPTLGVKPEKTELHVEPGSIASFTFSVNEVMGQEALHSVSLFATNFSGEEGSISSSAITFDVNNFDVPAGGSQTVTAVVVIPSNFKGSCSGSIVIESADGGAKRIGITLFTDVKVFVDIKPGVCPNMLYDTYGWLPVAVLGLPDFDVRTINPRSVRLSREGLDKSVAPVSWSFLDAATPFKGELCGCHTLTKDGYRDLVLKFDIKTLYSTLELGQVPGDTATLVLTGSLTGQGTGTGDSATPGKPIRGKDCVRLRLSGGDRAR